MGSVQIGQNQGWCQHTVVGTDWAVPVLLGWVIPVAGEPEWDPPHRVGSRDVRGQAVNGMKSERLSEGTETLRCMPMDTLPAFFPKDNIKSNRTKGKTDGAEQHTPN